MQSTFFSSPAGAQTAVMRLLADIGHVLKLHHPAFAAAGKQLVANQRPQISFEMESCEFTAECTGRMGPETVTIDWEPQASNREVLAYVDCTCPECAFNDFCSHTWAVLNTLQLDLQNPASAITKQLLPNPKDAWKQVLNPLDQFLQVTRQTAAPAPTDEPDKSYQTRLLYKVSLEYQHLSISVFEQNVRKSGEWSKGRKMTWGRFASEQFDYLGPVDRQVQELVRKVNAFPTYGNMSHVYYNSGVPDTWRLLRLLCEHPNVFTEGDSNTPLQINQAEIELKLQPTSAEAMAIVPCIGGRPISGWQFEVSRDHGMICHNLGVNQVYLWEAQAPQVELVKQLCRQPTTIPRTGVAEVLPRLTAMESSFKVTYPDEMKGQTLTGNAQTILRLVPRVSDGGLAAEIWVRPQAGGTYFEPGEGTDTIATWAREERVAVERDLPAERAAAEDCQRSLRLERFVSYRPWRWMLPGGDAALDFLSELQDWPNPAWTVEWSNSAVPRPDVVGEITPGDVELEIEQDRDWFGVEGTIDVGGESIPLMAVLDALRNNSKYVQLKGGKWAKIAAEFRDRLAALADLLHRNQSKLSIDVTAAPLLEDLFQDQQINIRAAAEWRQALQKLEQARRHNPSVPAGLKADLRDYQVDGYKWLSRLAAWGVGGCLADDMGLGKTVQALAILLERREVGPTLVVAPVSVGFNWVNETHRFAPSLRPHLYRDTERGEFLGDVKAGDIVVASYGLLLRDAEYFTKVNWGTLVLDEAQFIKNSRTKSAQVVRDIKADWRLTLTGTPVENQLSDLWSLFRATSPGLFGSWERFRERFADPIEKQKLPERSQALARTVRPFILRRTKEDVLKELPARTETILTAELSKAERKLYEDARLLALAQISGIDTGKNESRFQVLAMLTRLRQLACHPHLVDPKWKDSSAKLDLLLETVEEIREGKHRALIFSQFTSHLEIIRKALDERNISYLYLDGQTPAKQRRERVEAFQAGKGELFLISLKAGGTGLNLTGADYVIHMDPWWNPAVEDQATDRAHRIGQTKPVMVYRLVAQDTIEQKILALHDQKRNLVAGIMDGSDQAAKLSTDELVDLIKSTQTPEMPSPESDKPAKRTRAKSKKAK